MSAILICIVLVETALILTASKRCRQYKSIINRVAPSDPQYLAMVTKEVKR